MQSLWDFSNELYARPGVSAACLEIQDQGQADICVVMLLLWLAHQRRSPDVQAVHEGSLPWRNHVVRGLRTVRRYMKDAKLLVDPQESEALRSAVKALELRAERLELNAFEATFAASPLADASVSALALARRSLEAYSRVLGLEFPAPAVETVLSAFQEFETA